MQRKFCKRLWSNPATFKMTKNCPTCQRPLAVIAEKCTFINTIFNRGKLPINFKSDQVNWATGWWGGRRPSCWKLMNTTSFSPSMTMLQNLTRKTSKFVIGHSHVSNGKYTIYLSIWRQCTQKSNEVMLQKKDFSGYV